MWDDAVSSENLLKQDGSELRERYDECLNDLWLRQQPTHDFLLFGVTVCMDILH